MSSLSQVIVNCSSCFMPSHDFPHFTLEHDAEAPIEWPQICLCASTPFRQLCLLVCKLSRGKINRDKRAPNSTACCFSRGFCASTAFRRQKGEDHIDLKARCASEVRYSPLKSPHVGTLTDNSLLCLHYLAHFLYNFTQNFLPKLTSLWFHCESLFISSSLTHFLKRLNLNIQSV